MKSSSYFDAVIFDLFGTLVDIFRVESYNLMLARMAEELCVHSEAFIDEWVRTFPERATGVFASPEDNIHHVIDRLQLQSSTEQISRAAELRRDFARTSLVPRHDTIETLQAVRAAGLKTGLISDCSSEIPALWPETPFAPLFDAAVFSCSVGMCKPDPCIYTRICEQLSVAPNRCLYVGDGGSSELTGAERVGMTALLIRDPQEEANSVYRAGAEEWRGNSISTLQQLLHYI